MALRIGIRQEQKILKEKRAPLIPSHVRQLVAEHALDIRVEASTLRIFADEQYRREGARIQTDLGDCDIILAIKEIPLRTILPGKVYVFFSHTAKGQPQNMPMLKRLIDRRCTLIDYEKIVDDQGRRLVFFGKQAGQAGMVDSLWSLGQRLRLEGLSNPFAHIRHMPTYQSLVDAEEAVRKVGWEIKEKGLNPSLAPLVCGIAGYGHTSQGAQEIFGLLPVEQIAPQGLAGLFKKKNYSANRVYQVVFKEEDMVAPKPGHGAFDLQDYYKNPKNYRPRLSSYLPYLTMLINCIYWTSDYPRFVTLATLKKLYGAKKLPRLRVIGDISCDVKGSIESTVKATHLQKPVYVYDLKKGLPFDGFKGKGPVVMSVYNLPAEIPLESSVFFSQVLKDFIPALAGADFRRTFDDCHLPDPLKRAVILFNGEFTPSYSFMKPFVA